MNYFVYSIYFFWVISEDLKAVAPLVVISLRLTLSCMKGKMQFGVLALVFVGLLSFVLDRGVDGIPFNSIVPNLSTGWFFKPGPAESVLFGLLVLKVSFY